MGLLGVDPTKSNARGEVVFTDVSQDLADGLANPADPFTAQLNSTFVRFVDHITGETIDPAGTVVIKVDVSTGEIDDIVFEEV